ncbi:MAG TPA: DUF3592 domain-containing protein [Streptosporangiaceae bacterium]
MTPARYLAFLGACLCALLGVSVVWSWAVARRRVRQGRQVTGEVVGIKVRQGITGPPSYTFWRARQAVVRYDGPDGRAYTIEAGQDLPLGTAVKVACNPRHPSRAIELTAAGGGAAGGLGTGIALLAIAAALALVAALT